MRRDADFHPDLAVVPAVDGWEPGLRERALEAYRKRQAEGVPDALLRMRRSQFARALREILGVEADTSACVPLLPGLDDVGVVEVDGLLLGWVPRRYETGYQFGLFVRCRCCPLLIFTERFETLGALGFYLAQHECRPGSWTCRTCQQGASPKSAR